MRIYDFSIRERQLDVVYRQAIPVERGAVGLDVQIVAAKRPLSENARGSGHRANNRFDLFGKPVQLGQIIAEHLDADGRADTGRDLRPRKGSVPLSTPGLCKRHVRGRRGDAAAFLCEIGDDVPPGCRIGNFDGHP